MSDHPDNPFIRGYDGLSTQRLLAISCDDDCPLTYLPLHASQAHLPDNQVERYPCIFSDRFALITEGQEEPDDLDAQCRRDGIVRTVVHAVMADEGGESLHVVDTYTEAAARKVVHRLRFETGFYSGCWEISSAHVDADAHRFLVDLADIDTPSTFLFIAFRIPYSPAIGVKLMATPWTDAHLRMAEGTRPSG